MRRRDFRDDEVAPLEPTEALPVMPHDDAVAQLEPGFQVDGDVIMGRLTELLADEVEDGMYEMRNEDIAPTVKTRKVKMRAGRKIQAQRLQQALLQLGVTVPEAASSSSRG